MRYVLAAYVVLCVLVLVLMDLGNLRGLQHAITATPFGDKLAHATVAGGLTLLVNLTLLQSVAWPRWRVLMLGALGVATICLIEEASNLLTPYRGCEILDMVANCAGILMLGVLAPALVTRPLPQQAAA